MLSFSGTNRGDINGNGALSRIQRICRCALLNERINSGGRAWCCLQDVKRGGQLCGIQTGEPSYGALPASGCVKNNQARRALQASSLARQRCQARKRLTTRVGWCLARVVCLADEASFFRVDETSDSKALHRTSSRRRISEKGKGSITHSAQ